MRLSLLDLPQELLLEIFQLSCLDGGYTGRALSAVSRAVRAISAEHRYQSLAVDVFRSRTTRLLLRTLRATPEPLRRIRYLYINRGLLFSPQWDPWFGIDLPTRYKKEKETGRDLREIIRLAAPSVHTLTLIFHVNVRDSLEKGDLQLEDVRMPRLRELALDCPPEQLGRLPATFAPGLKRLCIPSRLLVEAFGRTLADTFPRLSHLLVRPLRHLSSEQWRTLRILMFAMRLHSSHYAHGPDVSQVPVLPGRGRRYILVSPCLPAAKGVVDTRQVSLWNCLKNCSARAHRFVILARRDQEETEENELVATTEDWKEQWTDSMQGKPGLWAYRNVPVQPSITT